MNSDVGFRKISVVALLICLSSFSSISFSAVKFYKDRQPALDACTAEHMTWTDPIFYGQPNPCTTIHEAWPKKPPYTQAFLGCRGFFRSEDTWGNVTWVRRYLGPYNCLQGSTYYWKVLEIQFFAYPGYYPSSCAPHHVLNPENSECIARNEEKDLGAPKPQQCSSKDVGITIEQTGGTNPINLGVGNKYQMEVDFFTQGPFPLAVVRNYNSISGRWQFFSEVTYSPGESIAQVIRPDGKKLPFTSDGAGGWIPDADISSTLVSFDDGAGNITAWRYISTTDHVEDYDAGGRLTKVTNREGLSHTFVNTSSAITVTDDFGQSLVFSLDAEGVVTGFIDTSGNVFTYIYDDRDRLAGITYPNNTGTRTYHYESLHYPSALTGITDERGNRLATWNYDILGRAISSEHASGTDKVTIDYSNLDDLIDPRAVVTNALGKQTTYHFTTIHGVRKVTQVEGHQSTNCAAANQSYTYDANGFKDLVTDWEGNVTDYDHSARGLEVQRIEAKGTPQQRVITTEWHPTFRLPTKITEPDRVIDFTYDSNGLLLERKETPLAQ